MSRIYVTGDTHGDVSRFSVDNFPDQKELSKDDYVIICGDFGLVWNYSKNERFWLDWLNKKPFTTLFVDGNHENFHLINEHDIVDFKGGKAHKIKDSVYHLMRGYVFEIDGKKIFTFGGAQSHDIQDGILDPDDFLNNPGEFRKVYNRWVEDGKMFRIKNYSWWEEELPNEEEMQRGRDNLDKVGWKVDYVITHCFPQSVASAMGYFKPDILTNYLDDISNKLNFKRWYAGHYHSEQCVFGKFEELFGRIVRIE